ncbi:YigZ family protein [[Clostridium] spiroforme]|nr:YigZ family protein [Thomasclavelia spiroformis]MBM6880105.1 YigZ family protein [Thomasclavelia spiroformis]MBM6931064.1 YigZ family protein [Thomasclavelia spiroformis]
MKSVKNISEHKLIIKKSEFICTLIPLDDENLIDTTIKQYKEKYKDATHNCIAYIIGHQERANDDGEPSGTAGLPMLNVIKKQELSNILVIVTRYFGGIKLGAGGLTRAYSQSVSEALKNAEIVEKHLVPLYKVTIDYGFTKKFEHLLKIHQIRCLNKEYTEKVTYQLYIEDEHFFEIIQELTSNQYEKQFIKKEYLEKTDTV